MIKKTVVFSTDFSTCYDLWDITNCLIDQLSLMYLGSKLRVAPAAFCGGYILYETLRAVKSARVDRKNGLI